MSTLYDTDFAAWAEAQAALLRAGDLAAADIANIAEEIASLGRREKRELVSRLRVLLLHLLKWQFQPDRRSASWRLSIMNSREQLADHLADNPSLMTKFPDAIVQAYRYARRDAAIETGLHLPVFPEECPWSNQWVMSDKLPEVK